MKMESAELYMIFDFNSSDEEIRVSVFNESIVDLVIVSTTIKLLSGKWSKLLSSCIWAFAEILKNNNNMQDKKNLSLKKNNLLVSLNGDKDTEINIFALLKLKRQS